MPVAIQLPPTICVDDVVSFARLLSEQGDPASELSIDFSGVQYFEVTPMSLLLGKFLRWTTVENKVVRLNVPSQCKVYPYMHRMDFFMRCGLSPPGAYRRRPPHGRFREFAAVGSQSDAEKIAEEIADCVVPSQAEELDPDKSQCHSCVGYCVSEMLLNAVQHSWSLGYVGCQYYPSKDTIQIAIADHGKVYWVVSKELI